MRSRVALVVGWTVPIVYILGVAVWLVVASQVTLEEVVFLSAFGWFALLGGLIVTRQPRNAMGWLLATTGLLVGLTGASHAWATSLYTNRGSGSTLIALLAWPDMWHWYALLTLVLVVIPLVFPSGRLPSPRWRPLLWVPVGAAAVMCGLAALVAEIPVGPDLGEGRDTVANPIGIPGLAHVEELPIFGPLTILMVAGIGAGFAALAVRFRRSHGVERQQIKWLLAGVAPMPLVVLAEVLPIPSIVGSVGLAVVVNAIPLAIGFAVLRFRLYEIDRLVSRTATYALVVGVLAALYATTVVAFQALLAPVGPGSDLAVAASTLLAAGAFGPLRRRVRSAVDRRFDRARYDAHRTVESFARRLRDEVDLGPLTDDLRGAVVAALRPRQVSVWLAGSEPDP